MLLPNLGLFDVLCPFFGKLNLLEIKLIEKKKRWKTVKFLFENVICSTLQAPVSRYQYVCKHMISDVDCGKFIIHSSRELDVQCAIVLCGYVMNKSCKLIL